MVCDDSKPREFRNSVTSTYVRVLPCHSLTLIPLTSSKRVAGMLFKRSHSDYLCNRFNYANKNALGLFQATWDELIGQPSTSRTEDVNQASDCQD